jgi:8-oxo-dGTP pyrophosphatase MutT (NUDIX family)
MVPPRNRRLWQRLSPIARIDDDTDESPDEQNEADESDGLEESCFTPAPQTLSHQNTNISDVTSPEDEANTIIKSIESPEPSSAFESLQLSNIGHPPEERVSPSGPDPRSSEFETEDNMANAPSSPKAASIPSSHTLNFRSERHRPLEVFRGSAVTDHCYGFVLLHYPDALPADIDTISVLLIHQKRRPNLPSYWGFPKGHPEPEDHDNWATALRELYEETALNPEGVQPLTPSNFHSALTPSEPVAPVSEPLKITSRYPSQDGLKEVTYFLARVAEYHQMTEQAEEVEECRWVKVPVARQLLDTKPVRKVLNELIRLVSSNPEQDVLSESE